MKGSQSLITYVFLGRSVLGNRLDNTAAAQMSGETWLNDPGEKKKWKFQNEYWPQCYQCHQLTVKGTKIKKFCLNNIYLTVEISGQLENQDWTLD